MKKMIAMILVLAMALSLVACGNKEAAAEVTPLEGTMEENALKVMEIAPVEFMGGCIPVDLTDADSVSYFTGLSDGSKITDAAVYESMMGSHAFSLVLVRTAEGADAKAVAQEMTDNIDTRKWICVGADEKIVAGYGDTVMLIMLDTQLGLSAQNYVDAFQQVCGADLSFTI